MIGEINMASTVRSKALLTARPAESPGRVQTQPRKSGQFPSQSVIGEIKSDEYGANEAVTDIADCGIA